MITVTAVMTIAAIIRHRLKRTGQLLALLCLVLGLGCSTPEETQPETEEAHPQVALEIENYGTIVIELDREAAPVTVDNFLTLVDEGFYDGLTFHRIIEGFMMQGGSPTGTGTGGSSTTIKGEFASNGWDNPILHERGVISMARAKDPDSASSQFFIMHQDAPHLDGSYAAFGRVVSGMEIVDAVCADAKPIDNNGTIAADEQPRILSIKRTD